MRRAPSSRLPTRRAGSPVAGCVDADQLVVEGERVGLRAPAPAGLGEPVHQHERRSVAAALGVQGHGVDPGRRRVLGWGRDGAPTRGSSGHLLRHARGRVGARRRRARGGLPGIALDADGPGVGRLRRHRGPRPPRRAQRRLPRAGPGPRHGGADGRADHERHGRRRAAPVGRRGATSHACPCSCAPRTGPPSCSMSALRRPSTRRTSSDGPSAGSTLRASPTTRPRSAGDPWPLGPTPSRPGRARVPSTSTWPSASRSWGRQVPSRPGGAPTARGPGAHRRRPPRRRPSTSSPTSPAGEG